MYPLPETPAPSPASLPAPPVAGRGTTEGNRLQLLVGGEPAYEAMTDAIRSARVRVWLEAFIFMPDKIGQEFLDLLDDAAGRGLDVIVVVDHPGSGFFALGSYQRLKDAGVQVVFFNPVPPWWHLGKRVGSVLNRDHRKILITDDTAFCGGHNFSKEYLGPGQRPFLDISVQIDGPAVHDLARVFIQTLEQSDGALISPVPDPAPIEGGVPAAVHMMDRKHGVDEADLALLDMLRGARHRCYMMIAYFFPERWLIEELAAAAGRGVDVRIMSAGKIDVPVIRPALHHLYDDLLRAGVRLFELSEQKLHAKAAVADSEHLLVGTFDYNRLSAEFSLEVAVTAHDPELGRQIEETFLVNLDRSIEFRSDEWEQRGVLRRTGQRLAFGALDLAARIRRKRRRHAHGEVVGPLETAAPLPLAMDGRAPSTDGVGRIASSAAPGPREAP
jgi:cardiolipin synthase A/B